MRRRQRDGIVDDIPDDARGSEAFYQAVILACRQTSTLLTVSILGSLPPALPREAMGSSRGDFRKGWLIGTPFLVGIDRCRAAVDALSMGRDAPAN